jgi:tripartite-type tricarboxylate transporter receptor subunit TctC
MRRMTPRLWKILGAAALCAAASALAQGPAPGSGQAWPSKPIRLVVGFPPGGGNDIVARLLGANMQETWGQPVVVENRPGAASIIAAELVAKAAPDGYSLLVNATGGMSINPVLYPKLPYDPLRDFEPIGMVGVFPLVLVVHPSVPARSVRELIAYARKNPGKLNYSAGSTSFQVATEMFKQMTGTDIRHIPYKGSAASINAVLAGDVQLTIVDTPPLAGHLQSDRIRALAVTSAKRAPGMPDLPTLAEAGVPRYDMSLWIGLFAPAGTPGDIVARLSAEVARIVRVPEVREKLVAMGVDPLGNGPEQVTEWIRNEIARYGPVVKAANIRAE